MSTHSIPNSQGQVTQMNSGDIYGELWGSFGIDLTTSRERLNHQKTQRHLATTKWIMMTSKHFYCLAGI